MSVRRTLRVRQRIQFARERRVLSRRSAAGSSPLVAGHRQVHETCEAETWKRHTRGIAQHSHRGSVLGHKGSRRKRLALSTPDSKYQFRLSDHKTLIDELYLYGICFVRLRTVGKSRLPFCEETA
jgi:hypothetical protein